MSAGSLTCTECGEKTDQTTSSWWTAEKGWIIGEDEKLCSKCANERGFGGLLKLYKQREKSYRELQNEQD